MRALKLTVAALIAMPLGALAQGQSMQSQSTTPTTRPAEGETSSSCIKSITFSHEFLERWPRAGAACREVKVENGAKWARFDAEVVRVRGSRVTANFVDTFGHKLNTVTFDAASDARVEMNGRPTRFRSLRRGDKLSFWMPESRVEFYSAPGASDSEKLTVVSSTPAKR